MLNGARGGGGVGEGVSGEGEDGGSVSIHKNPCLID